MSQTPTTVVPESSTGLVADLAAGRAARQRLERRLTDLERQIADVEAAASLGIWEWDTATDAIHWSDGQLRLHGLTRAQNPGTFEDFLVLVHPDDRDMIVRECDDLRQTGRPFSFPYRVVRPDGTVRWLVAHGQMVSPGRWRSGGSRCCWWRRW